VPDKYGNVDWLDKALPILNSLEIVDFDADGETLYYCLIEDTEENQKTLKQAGVTQKEIDEAISAEGQIDLTSFIWKFAKWFDGDKFLRENPRDCI
jgi:hypothetical protein